MTTHVEKKLRKLTLSDIWTKVVLLREPRKNFLTRSKKKRGFWAKLMNKHEAEFIAWKSIPSGEHEPIYKILSPHPLHHYTVNAHFLLREGIEIPRTPRCPYA